jgi:hypothetical protein
MFVLFGCVSLGETTLTLCLTGGFGGAGIAGLVCAVRPGRLAYNEGMKRRKANTYDVAWYLLGDEGWEKYRLGRKVAAGDIGLLAIQGGDTMLGATGSAYADAAALSLVGLGFAAVAWSGLEIIESVRDAAAQGGDSSWRAGGVDRAPSEGQE